VYSFSVTPNGVRDTEIRCGDDIWHTVLNERTKHKAVLSIDGCKHSLFYHPVSPSHLQIRVGGHVYDVHDKNKMFAGASSTQNDGQVTAPMHGNMAEIFVKTGDVVAEGDRLGVLEAMKMRHEITAPLAGEVTEIFASAGEQISSGAPILTIKPKADT